MGAFRIWNARLDVAQRRFNVGMFPTPNIESAQRRARELVPGFRKGDRTRNLGTGSTFAISPGSSQNAPKVVRSYNRPKKPRKRGDISKKKKTRNKKEGVSIGL